nr:MFS transporter [Bacillus sp. FJAT-49736]
MFGSLFISMTVSMSAPFLAIYLKRSTDLGYGLIGLIVGVTPLTAAFGGIIGGILSDRLGRKKLLIVSLFVQSVSYVFLVLTANPIVLVLINSLRGLSSSFFTTISKALMADLTKKEKRYKLFSSHYLVVNIGYIIGPMIGVILGATENQFTFIYTALCYLLYGIGLTVLLCFIHTGPSIKDCGPKTTFLISFTTVRKDIILWFFIMGGILLTMVHGQISVILSQYLNERMSNGAALFGILMSTNGISVICLQLPILRFFHKCTVLQRLSCGIGFFILGEAGFAFSTNWAWFIISMVIFTVGEILIIPAENEQIDEITPNHLRGAYYGAQGFTSIGSFLGPWIGGILLSKWGGKPMFFSMMIFAIISLAFYMKGHYLRRKIHSQTGMNTST